MKDTLYVGCAGWAVPKDFPGEGSHLQRYARVLNASEINSSFYRPHQQKTYARWAESVPVHFRFSVKVPKTISHERGLVGVAKPLAAFLDEVSGLGPKLGVLLLQLPPSFAFAERAAGKFFELLRKRYDGAVALEPRHATWFTKEVDGFLAGHEVSRVAADPARVPEGARPGGSKKLRYYRWHGSPRVYYSSYTDEQIAFLRKTAPRGAWCIFDNTASGAAFPNALTLAQRR